MKLRAVEMTNLRRFAGRTVRVGGIGDGVSVLAAPNEAGKSTLFDALQAVLFQRHTGRGRAVTALQPHQGGAPEAAVEIELDGAVWRIEKRWLSRPSARVLDGAGALVAQADAAEAWIDAQLGDRLGGPAGLLWVRQGQAGLDAAGPVETRRDILSQVAGEIDAMTGGRRMDAVLARVAAALDGLATATGRPRAGGPWDAALKEAEALAAQEADLAGRVATLEQALAERRKLERRRATLDDPADAAARAEGLARAEAAAEALRHHEARRAAASGALRLAEATEAAALARRDALRARADEAAAAAQALAEAEALQARAEAGAAAARAEAGRLTEALTGAQAALGSARAALAAAQAQVQAAAAGAQAAELGDRLARAEAAERTGAEAAQARAAVVATPQRVEAAQQAEAALARLAAQAEAQGVVLRFAYDGDARALRDGTPVEGPQRLVAPAVFALPGLGRLEVDPGAGAARARDLEAARAAREAALAACGAASLAEAVAALARSEDLARDIRAARQMGAALAPEGIAALRLKLEATQALAGDAPEGPAPDPAPLVAGLERAERAVAAAEAAERAAASAAGRAEAGAAAAGATAAAARARAAAAGAALGPPDGQAAALAAAESELGEARSARTGAAQAVAALAEGAPDAASVAAALARAKGAERAHAEERGAAEARLLVLQGQIGALAEQGIEEALAELRGRLAAAQARAAAQGAEVTALLRLRAALAAARGAARSAYFAPVLAELAPLLSLLHPGAGVAMGDADLLPVALERGGVAEGLDILSGGAREQVAVLTRLAFARLWARAGRAVPVILDDALVQTDDERIEAMFTALHRAAQDQQVIVLTCRQRAFAALGGQRLELVDGGPV
jgi:hypothetical protein